MTKEVQYRYSMSHVLHLQFSLTALSDLIMPTRPHLDHVESSVDLHFGRNMIIVPHVKVFVFNASTNPGSVI